MIIHLTKDEARILRTALDQSMYAWARENREYTEHEVLVVMEGLGQRIRKFPNHKWPPKDGNFHDCITRYIKKRLGK